MVRIRLQIPCVSYEATKSVSMAARLRRRTTPASSVTSTVNAVGTGMPAQNAVTVLKRV